MSKQKRRKADLILVIGILLVAVAALGLIKMTRHQGATIRISVGGEVQQELPLDQDAQIVIEGVSGGHNNLTIEKGEAWLTEATCPDKLCVHMGHISQNAESIICLPNQVVVEVVNQNGGGTGVDGISGGR